MWKRQPIPLRAVERHSAAVHEMESPVSVLLDPPQRVRNFRSIVLGRSTFLRIESDGSRKSLPVPDMPGHTRSPDPASVLMNVVGDMANVDVEISNSVFDGAVWTLDERHDLLHSVEPDVVHPDPPPAVHIAAILNQEFKSMSSCEETQLQCTHETEECLVAFPVFPTHEHINITWNIFWTVAPLGPYLFSVLVLVQCKRPCYGDFVTPSCLSGDRMPEDPQDLISFHPVLGCLFTYPMCHVISLSAIMLLIATFRSCLCSSLSARNNCRPSEILH